MVPDPVFLAKIQKLSYRGISSSQRFPRHPPWMRTESGVWSVHFMASPLDEGYSQVQWPFNPSQALVFCSVHGYHFTLADRGHYAACPGTNQGSLSPGRALLEALCYVVPIEDKLKAATGRTPTTFFACYLMDTLNTEAAFGRAVLSTSQWPPTGFHWWCHSNAWVSKG